MNLRNRKDPRGQGIPQLNQRESGQGVFEEGRAVRTVMGGDPRQNGTGRGRTGTTAGGRGRGFLVRLGAWVCPQKFSVEADRTVAITPSERLSDKYYIKIISPAKRADNSGLTRRQEQ